MVSHYIFGIVYEVIRLTETLGAVRKFVGIEFLGETKDITMFLADVEIEGFEGTVRYI